MKIIAEVGSNVKSLDDCVYSIRKAKECGADAVKFQYFDSMGMYGQEGVCKPIFDKKFLPFLKERCDEYDIEFMCTFFNPRDLDEHVHLLDSIKIASSDMEYLQLIGIAKDTGKNIYLSTGGHTQHEIMRVVKIIGEHNPKLTLFYCESDYPTVETNFAKLFMAPFDMVENIGFSDHSREVYSTAQAALNHGVSVFEKHVNFCGYDDTPDAPHSLSTVEFGRMIDSLNGILPEDFLSPGESGMRLRYNRRLIATEKIVIGSPLVYGENFGCFRSIRDDVDGTSSFFYDIVNGTMSDRNYKPGDTIVVKDLKGLER